MVFLTLALIAAGIIKFNFINDDVYMPDGKGGYINEYGRKAEFVPDGSNRNDDLCDENGNRYASETEALKAGLARAEFGATYCPEYKMHPTWDKNRNDINDCYEENNCSKDLDYMSPRK